MAMASQARLNAPGALHHIIIRGIERKAIFKDHIDASTAGKAVQLVRNCQRLKRFKNSYWMANDWYFCGIITKVIKYLNSPDAPSILLFPNQDESNVPKNTRGNLRPLV
jgi:hypothetical protein